MYRLAELSSYPGNPPTCTSITAIDSIERSLRFLGRFKSNSTQNCFCPGRFFVPFPSPARSPQRPVAYSRRELRSESLFIAEFDRSVRKGWHAILYLITPLRYLQRLGMPFYILSRLGSISQRTSKLENLTYEGKLKLNKLTRTAKAQARKTQAKNAQVEQT